MTARNKRRCLPMRRRRAVVAVQVAVMMTVLVAFAALTIDVGVMYNARADLQRTADAAALAAASRLADYGYGDPIELARAEAMRIVAENLVLDRSLTLEPETDVVFGRAYYIPETNNWEFVPTEVMPDAVNVRVRHTEESPNGPAELYFARIFGRESVDITAEATAIMMPRDIAVVQTSPAATTTTARSITTTSPTSTSMMSGPASPIPTGVVRSPTTSASPPWSPSSDNGDGTSTVSVQLTSDDSEGTPALSHLTIGLPEDAWDMAEDTATSDGGYPIEIGNDPTTGVAGIKFDETNLGEDGVQETEMFGFTIPTEYVEAITVATKAGHSYATTEHGVSAGPTWGIMDTWGTVELGEYYDPGHRRRSLVSAQVRGLERLRSGDPAVRAGLLQQRSPTR